ISTNMNIMEIIVNDFINYLTNVRVNSDVMNTIFKGLYVHRVNLELRFEFIVFLYQFTENKKFKIELNGKQLTSLWDNLVINAKHEGEKNLFYKFLINNHQEDFNDTFTERISEYLFNEILTKKEKFDVKNLSYVGFKLFRKY